MKKYLLLVIFFLCFLNGHPQTSFVLDSAISSGSYQAVFSDDAIYIYNSIYSGANSNLIKTDYSGNVKWSRWNPFNRMIEVAGELYGIRRDSVIKMDTSGNLQWIKRFSTPICPNSGVSNEFTEIVFDGNQLYLHEIQDFGSSQSVRPVTMIIDTAGNILNTRCDSIFIGQMPNYRNSPGCASTIGGAIFSCGRFSSNSFYSFCQEENPNGTMNQSANWPVFHSGHMDYIIQIIPSADGNYFILSNTENNYPVNWIGGMFTVLKVTQAGSIIWKYTACDTASVSGIDFKVTSGRSIATDDNNQVYIIGSAGITSNYGGLITSKIDKNGNMLFTKLWKYSSLPFFFNSLYFHDDRIYCQAGSSVIVFDTLFNHDCLQPDSSISLMNYFTIQGSGTLGRSSYNVTYLSSNDPITSIPLNVTSHDLCSTLNTQETINLIELEIIPNPTSGKFKIELPDSEHNIRLMIYNAMGELISIKIESGKYEIQLDLTNYPAGIYFVHIISNEKFIIQKVIKE